MLVHESAWNFSRQWIKAKAAFLFDSISTLFLLPPKPPGSNFGSSVTQKGPASLDGMRFVLSAITANHVSLLTNAFSSSSSLLRSGSHEYLASSQSCLAIDDSNSHVRHELPHILLCSQRLCTTSLCARAPTITPPPCLHATPASHPLVLVEQNPNTLLLYI